MGEPFLQEQFVQSEFYAFNLRTAEFCHFALGQPVTLKNSEHVATPSQDLTFEGLGLEFTDIHTQPSYFSQQSEVPGHYNLGGGNAGGG